MGGRSNRTEQAKTETKLRKYLEKPLKAEQANMTTTQQRKWTGKTPTKRYELGLLQLAKI